MHWNVSPSPEASHSSGLIAPLWEQRSSSARYRSCWWSRYMLMKHAKLQVWTILHFFLPLSTGRAASEHLPTVNGGIQKQYLCAPAVISIICLVFPQSFLWLGVQRECSLWQIAAIKRGSSQFPSCSCCSHFVPPSKPPLVFCLPATLFIDTDIQY